MRIIDLSSQQEISAVNEKCAVAIGNFDGVHTAHRALIQRMVSTAEGDGLSPAVWTFGEDFPKNKSDFITTVDERLRLFAALGVKYVFLYSFEDVRNTPCDKFVLDILIEQCKAEAVFCGYNFRFGKGAEGDFEILHHLMQQNGKRAFKLDAFTVGEEIVSSSLIREKIKNGDIEAANCLLGRRFSLFLPVLHGREIGRTIGVPTINQSFPQGHLVPKRGVYAAVTTVDGVKYESVANVGVRPSVGIGIINCETHIIGYAGDLYGRRIRVELCKYIRPEQKFPSLDCLKNAISADIETAKAYFKAEYNV